MQAALKLSAVPTAVRRIAGCLRRLLAPRKKQYPAHRSLPRPTPAPANLQGFARVGMSAPFFVFAALAATSRIHPVPPVLPNCGVGVPLALPETLSGVQQRVGMQAFFCRPMSLLSARNPTGANTIKASPNRRSATDVTNEEH
jgi:hypothetical protein